MQIDHTNYPKQLRRKSLTALLFIIKDCKEALTAMPDNPKAGYYQDEIHYAAAEIQLRQRGLVNPNGESSI